MAHIENVNRPVAPAIFSHPQDLQIQSADWHSRQGQSGSAEEEEMWVDYDMNGAVFEAGEDLKSKERAERQRLERIANMFGTWGGTVLGSELRLDGEDEALLGNMEEDDFLSDIIQNAGMLSFILLFYSSLTRQYKTWTNPLQRMLLQMKWATVAKGTPSRTSGFLIHQK
jgi:hypothetical protein